MKAFYEKNHARILLAIYVGVVALVLINTIQATICWAVLGSASAINEIPFRVELGALICGAMAGLAAFHASEKL